MKVNDFSEDLKWAESMQQWAEYLPALAHFYPEVDEWARVLGMAGQKAGKDLHLTIHGERRNIQIKARRADYGDMCIEWRHDRFDGTHRPGWIETYQANSPHDILYFSGGHARRIETASLKHAWAEHREEWIGRYDLPPARNRDYDTRNVGVPWIELLRAGVLIEDGP